MSFLLLNVQMLHSLCVSMEGGGGGGGGSKANEVTENKLSSENDNRKL